MRVNAHVGNETYSTILREEAKEYMYNRKEPRAQGRSTMKEMTVDDNSSKGVAGAYAGVFAR